MSGRWRLLNAWAALRGRPPVAITRRADIPTGWFEDGTLIAVVKDLAHGGPKSVVYMQRQERRR